jgi:glycosyltransferase involved in cell wall biosynthesis
MASERFDQACGKDLPLVSVIIPTYNGSRFLAETIESALAQTYPHKEILVVDDGSTDDTRAVVSRYEGSVRYVYQANAGTAAARNTGIRAASGSLIALLDHDDRWLPHKLERQVPYFLEDPEVGLCHTGGRVVDAHDGHVTSEYLPRPVLDVHDLMRWCVVGCATTMFPRAVVEEVGTFDPEVSGADDWDMWIRIALDHKVVGCLEILVEIREHEGNQGKRIERMFSIVRRVVEKHPSVHPGCRLCAEAHREARRRLLDDYYAKTAAQAVRAWRHGRYVDGVRLRLQAIARNPAALKRLAGRHRVKG